MKLTLQKMMICTRLNFYLIMIVSWLLGTFGSFSYANESVLYSPKRTYINKEQDVYLIGMFPLGQTKLKKIISDNDKEQIISLGIVNDSRQFFNLKTIKADNLFVGDYELISNCPSEGIAAKESCEYQFKGVLKTPGAINSDTKLTLVYVDQDNEINKDVYPWEAVLALNSVFDFSEEQTIVIKNIFPEAVTILRVELSEGIYGEFITEPQTLMQEISNIVPKDNYYEIVLPPQERITTQYRTLIIEYQVQQQQHRGYLELTNLAYFPNPTNPIGESKPQPSKEQADGFTNNIYNNWLAYTVPAGVTWVAGTVCYFGHKIAKTLRETKDIHNRILQELADKLNKGIPALPRMSVAGVGAEVGSGQVGIIPVPPPLPLPTKKQTPVKTKTESRAQGFDSCLQELGESLDANNPQTTLARLREKKRNRVMLTTAAVNRMKREVGQGKPLSPLVSSALVGSPHRSGHTGSTAKKTGENAASASRRRTPPGTPLFSSRSANVSQVQASSSSKKGKEPALEILP